MRGGTRYLVSAYRIWIPVILAIVAVALIYAAANADDSLHGKINAYNEGARFMDQEECSLSAAEGYVKSLSSSLPKESGIDIRSKYNIGTLILNCVITEQLDPEALLIAREFLIEALREANTGEGVESISDQELIEIRKQLEVVNNRLESEDLLGDSDDGSGDSGEEGEEESPGEGSEETDDPSSGSETRPPSRFRPEGDY